MALEITDANFEEVVVNADKPVLVDFWAEWCGPCKMLGPVIDKIHDAHSDQYVIGKVNVDQNPETAAKFGIRSIPTVLFFKDGEVKDKQVGVAPENTYVEKLGAI